MGLNVELVSTFAKLTANKKETKKESTAWGTVVEVTESGKCFVQLDGSDRVTPVDTMTEAKVGDRVAIAIKNHAATLTGNTSSPSINADGSTIGSIRTDFKNISADNVAIRGLLTASEARIDDLTAKNLKVEETLEAHTGKFVNLEADVAEFERLSATFATFDELTAQNAEFRNLLSDYATIENLRATNANVEYITANYATIASLNAVDAKIGNLDADVADINELIFGAASGTTIHTNFANAVIAQLGDAQIKSAMIKDISTQTIVASQITSGDIITDNINVKSQDGKLLIADQTIQISDASRVRVQIGKDAANDYSINIWDASGKLMFSEGGLTEDAVKEQIIRNDMVKDDANISASKLDIDTLFNVINEDGSHTLKSNKIKLDEQNQTLDVAFGAMTTKIDGISIGGRNLVADTSLNTIYSGVQNPDLGYKDVWSAKTIDIPTGTEYIVSFDAKADENIDIRCFFYSPNTTLTSESSTGDHRGDNGTAVTDGVSVVSITSEWKRYWVKWTQTPATETKSVIIGRNSSLTNRVYIRAVKLEAGNKPTDWSPAPEDVDVKTTELSTKYSELQVSVTGLSSTIAEQSQLIEKKADSSTVSTLSTQYSTLKQSVDGLSSTVNSHTTQIANKADGSTVTTLSNRFVELESNLDGFQSTVRDTYTTKTDFNNLSIGGRNLLLNTSRSNADVMVKGATATSAGMTERTNVDGIQTYTYAASGTEAYYRFMSPALDNLYGLEPGETYILSGKVKLSTTSGTLERLAVRTQYNTGSAWSGGVNFNILTADSSEWVDFQVMFTIEDSARGYYISFQTYYVGSWAGVIQTKELKLEKGTKKTGWTPAPEDVDADITAVTNRVSAAETKIDQNADSILLRATKTELTDGINAAKSYADAQIKVSSDALTLSVENISRSGRNLIKDSSQKDTALGGYPTSGHNEGVGGKTTIAPTENEYVLSFEAKSTVANDMIRCFFYSPNTTTKAESSVGTSSTSQDGNIGIRLTTSWKRYWIKYTQNGSSTTTQKNWLVGRRLAGEGSGTISVRCLKLEAGHNPTPWSAAQEDTDGKISSVRSEIQALADSITLSVSGGLGGTASIKLSANGETTTQSIDMSKVRQAFANDQTGITISAGTVRFNANTLLVESTNFKLDASGNLEATNAKLSGDLTTIDGYAKAELSAGDLTFYYARTSDNPTNYKYTGMLSTKMLPNDTQVGLHIIVPKAEVSGLKFVVRNQAATSYYTLYHLNTPYIDSGEEAEYCYKSGNYIHNFYDSVEFVGITRHESPSYFDEVIYMGNNASIGWLDKNDRGPWQLITFTNTNTFDIGSTDYETNIEGSFVDLVCKSAVRFVYDNGYVAIVNAPSSTYVYQALMRPSVAGGCTLGATALPFYRAYVQVAESVISDIRAKENIVPLVNTHSELFDRLIPVQYNLIDDGDRIHYGFVAQQVSAAMAELGIDESELDLLHHSDWIDETTGEFKDQYSLVYQNFIALLVHEVQKLKTEIKSLKGE